MTRWLVGRDVIYKPEATHRSLQVDDLGCERIDDRPGNQDYGISQDNPEHQDK